MWFTEKEHPFEGVWERQGGARGCERDAPGQLPGLARGGPGHQAQAPASRERAGASESPREKFRTEIATIAEKTKRRRNKTITSPGRGTAGQGRLSQKTALLHLNPCRALSEALFEAFWCDSTHFKLHTARRWTTEDWNPGGWP